MNISSIRSRWAAVGAAVAVSLGAGGIGISHATISSGERPVYVPIEPCRLVDNRPGGIGEDSSVIYSGWGAVGDCNLPTTSTGLALNVTAVGATQQTNLRFYPADAGVPDTANLNPTPGAPPTPNAVNVDLDSSGEFGVYNRFGTVATVIDVMGFYEDHNHDDRYYTEAEVDALLAGAKSIAAHSGTNGSLFLQLNTPQVAESVSLVAPVAGTVIVTANAYAGDTVAGTTGVRCSISNNTAINFSFLLYSLGDFDGQTRPFAGTRGFEVSAGETFTANLMCDINSGGGYVQDRSMSAIFVPG